MKIVVEKGVELSNPHKSDVRSPALLAMRSMDVSDSFFVRGVAAATVAQWVYKGNSTWKEKRFASRKQGDGYRIWRVS
jgi:hypothetical protein